MTYSVSALMKIGRKELVNTVLDYQHKSDNFLDSINPKLLEQKAKFTKMESVIAIS